MICNLYSSYLNATYLLV